MSFGIAELITLLLGLQGFGLQANPKAPTPDASLQYAIADADVVGHFDAVSVIPGNYKVLSDLPNQPAIKANPELAKMVRKFINEVDGPRNMAKGLIGLDPVTDINDATAFLKLMPQKAEPSFLIAVHGKFNVAMIDKIAKMNNKASVKVGAAAFVDPGDGPAIGVTKDGVMLAGTPALVKERVADTWKTPAHGAGTNLGAAADVLAQHPVFAVVLTMSQSARAEALKNMPGQNFATDMIKRHKMAAFSVYTDGIGWQWGDSTAAGLDAMAQISDGFADLLRSAAIAPRGFGKIILGALESYRGTNKQLDQVIARKADIQKIIESYTGDGSFKVKIDKDPKALKLNVRLTGKSLSEVIPFGVALPGAAFFLLVGRKADSPPPPTMMPTPMPPMAPAPRPIAPTPPPSHK